MDEFKKGPESEIVEKVQAMVMQDRSLKNYIIVNDVGISDERTFYVLTANLGVKLLLTRWVPHILTIE